MRKIQVYIWLLSGSLILIITFLLYPFISKASDTGINNAAEYAEYIQRMDGVRTEPDISAAGFRVLENQRFPIILEGVGEVSFIPAIDEDCHRLILFFADQEGNIVCRTESLAANSQRTGSFKQMNQGIAAVSFQDMNEDNLMDIVLITSCFSETGKTYKIGDVLFQKEGSFYRDWRISDKINRYGMNKSIALMNAFIKEGYSTEFLYTATTLKELTEKGFQIDEDLCYFRDFEKSGRLQVVPGFYQIAEYHVFHIFLVNEEGYIVWSLQPMGDYEDLYALKGLTCRDIDGDGMKDILVLAKYSYVDETGKQHIVNDYAVYYQRTGGFYTDTDFKKSYVCGDKDTVNELVEKARAFWGWGISQ